MICKVCGAFFMEGSPYCPSCKTPTEDGEIKAEVRVDTLNKGTMSGDVVLSEDKRTVLAAEDNVNLSDKTSFDAPKEEFVKKKYSLKQDDRKDAERVKQTLELNEEKREDVYDPEFFEEVADEPLPVPKWKIEQERLKQKKNIRSAHSTGKVQGGETFPVGLSLDEFLKLQKLSKIRHLYYSSIVMLYIDSLFELILVLLMGRMPACLAVVFLTVACTLLIQFKNSIPAALIMTIVSLFYTLIMSLSTFTIFGFDMFMVSVLALVSTVYTNRLYSNHLATLTVPDKLSDVFKV